MEALGILVIVLLILGTAINAIRRDPRFDRREILVQSAWIAAFFAMCAGMAPVLIALGRRTGAAIAALLALAWIVLSMIVLAKYLQRRLQDRDRKLRD